MTDLRTQLTRYLDTVSPPLDIEQIADDLFADVETLQASSGRDPRRRRPLVAAAAAVMVLVVLGGLSWLYTRLTEPSPPVVTEAPPSSTTLPPPTGDSATITTLEPVADIGSYTGHFPTLAFGSDGLPVISYLVEHAPESFGFKIGRCADPACTTLAAEAEIPVTGWAQPPTLLIGDADRPVLAFVDDEAAQPTAPGTVEMRVKIAACSDPACTTHTITDVGRGQGVSMRRLEAGFLLVYQSLEDPAAPVNLAVLCTDLACTDRTDPAVLPGDTWDIGEHGAATSGGLAVLAYTTGDPETRQNTMSLYFCSDAACSSGRSQPVAQSVANSFVSGLVLDESNIPTMTFLVEHYELFITRCLDRTCQQATTAMSVGGRQPPGLSTPLALGSDGMPLVATASEADPPSIRLARCADAMCSEGTTVIVAEADNPWDVTMAIGPGSLPHLIYYSPGTGPVLVRCADAACQAGAPAAIPWNQADSIVTVEPIGEILPGWSRISDDDGLFPSQGGIMGLATDGSVAVAVGGSRAWRAESALEWEAVPDMPAGDLWTVVAGGPGFVAAGSTCGLAELDADCTPAIWTSVDGWEWQRVPPDESVFASCASSIDAYCQVWIDDLVAGPGGHIVATGRDGLGGGAWHSADGRSWARTELGLAVDWFDPVVATENSFVLSGNACTETGCDALAWTSPDGTDWQPAEPFPGFLQDVTAYQGRLYAVGYEELVSVSSDGLSWEPVDTGVAFFEGEGLVRVFTARSGLLAVGLRFDETTGIEDGVFLTSEDGVSWMAWAADPDVFPRLGINDAVQFDGVLVAGGADRGPALWIYDP